VYRGCERLSSVNYVIYIGDFRDKVVENGSLKCDTLSGTCPSCLDSRNLCLFPGGDRGVRVCRGTRWYLQRYDESIAVVEAASIIPTVYLLRTPSLLLMVEFRYESAQGIKMFCSFAHDDRSEFWVTNSWLMSRVDCCQVPSHF
jgi:hypothetical protein